MSENKITTNITEVTFDDVIAEFDKESATDTPINLVAPTPESKDFDKTKEQIAKEEDEEKKKKEAAAASKTETPVQESELVVTDAPVKDIDSVLESDEEEEVEVKQDTSSLFSAIEKLIEDEVIFPFDEEKPIAEYTADDIRELLKANIDHQRKDAVENEVGEFFEALPKQLQYAAKYVAEGGTDLKGLFKALAATEEIKTLDTTTSNGRETVIREYYRAIDWGTDEEIEEELEKLREGGDTELEKVANKFKPKLEKMFEEVTKDKIARQERAQEMAREEAQQYLDNAHEAIKAGKLGSIALDKKTQTSLWAGLTQTSYQTRRGTTTNELGHLLEKYQYTEPNFELMYQVLWLLKDPEGFKESIGKAAKTETVSETARVLRTEQGKKTATTLTKEEKTDNKVGKKAIKRTIPPSFMGGFK
jgi:hypothetical protein